MAEREDLRGCRQVAPPPGPGWDFDDATNSFKAYSRDFIRAAGIELDTGFTLGIEMVAKAKRRGLPVEEIPTIWLDRAEGTSNFRVSKWIAKYLHWYLVALRPSRRPKPAPSAGANRD